MIYGSTFGLIALSVSIKEFLSEVGSEVIIQKNVKPLSKLLYLIYQRKTLCDLFIKIHVQYYITPTFKNQREFSIVKIFSLILIINFIFQKIRYSKMHRIIIIYCLVFDKFPTKHVNTFMTNHATKMCISASIRNAGTL